MRVEPPLKTARVRAGAAWGQPEAAGFGFYASGPIRKTNPFKIIDKR